MTLREFAGYLGISDRTISKWEAGGVNTVPRPHSQAILDTALAHAPDEARLIFTEQFARLSAPSTTMDPRFSQIPVESHKFVPVFVGVDNAAHLRDGMTSQEPMPDLWLEHSHAPIGHPDARSCTLYAFACGVALFHLVQDRTPANLTEMALWRYRSYVEDLPWTRQALARELDLAGPDTPTAEYVLSLYRLDHAPWNGTQRDTALRLLSTPSVLVDRQSSDGPRPLDPSVEMNLLNEGFDHQDIVSFGVREVATGYAGWSGVAYHAHAPERALTIDELVTCELTVQALWCFCRRIEVMVEEGEDPAMPAPYGWRFLRAAHSRLTTPRAQETAQHCLMREAIMATSGLSERLRTGQEALRDTYASPAERR